MKSIIFIVVGIIILIILYFIGPKLAVEPLNVTLPQQQVPINQLDSLIKSKESNFSIKKDNEARIVWYDEINKKKTEFVLLYLHGYSASYREGHPINRDFATAYGCNMYLSRLQGHGLLGDDLLLDMTPSDLYDSAKEALAIAAQLGQNVIIMSSSTGGTLSLKLAADFPDMVHSLILYSPNIEIKDKSSKILTGPWGLKIARQFIGGDFRQVENTEEEAKYWYSKYRIESIIYLQALIEQSMTKETFNKVTQPVFVGYYYKDEEHQDEVVNVSAIQDMFTELGTKTGEKRIVAFPEAGSHVIACDITSGAVSDIKKETFRFAETILGLNVSK